jgi:hypothetical protein
MPLQKYYLTKSNHREVIEELAPESLKKDCCFAYKAKDLLQSCERDHKSILIPIIRKKEVG